MDTPKRVVSFLESFPPDIWAYFVYYLSGELIGQLKMTGSALLTQRLKSPNVVKSIKLETDSTDFKLLLRLFNEFPSLEELSIHSSNMHRTRTIGLKVALIPSRVRKLVLTGKWHQWAETLFGANGSTLKLNEYLPRLEFLHFNSGFFSSSSDSWMTHAPRSLTSLVVPRWNGDAELPYSLIHFKANQVALSTSSNASKLPSSLESFVVLDGTRGVDLILPLLPPSTHKLSFGIQAVHSDGPTSSQNLLELLPPALTSFVVPHAIAVNFGTTSEILSLLPATLTDLSSFTGFPCSAWIFFPRNLTKLSLQAHASECTVDSVIIDKFGVHHDVKSVPFDSLPKSISSLELVLSSGDSYCCGPPTVSSHSYFPPQLTKMEISQIQLSPDTAKLLPSSLTHLELGGFCERVCEHLPKGLQKLMAYKVLMSPNLIKFLPKSLTYLYLSILSAYDKWFDSNTGAELSSVSDISEYSIHEMCLSSDFDWKDYPRFPSTLTYLVVDRADELGDSFLLHQPLPNLRELRLGASMHFTDVSIPILSPNLTTLDLRYSRNISGKSFQFLPRCLTTLNLDRSESIFDSEIQHLPRTLKTISFASAIHLTDLCIPDLPPHLTNFSTLNKSLSIPSTLSFYARCEN